MLKPPKTIKGNKKITPHLSLFPKVIIVNKSLYFGMYNNTANTKNTAEGRINIFPHKDLNRNCNILEHIERTIPNTR